MEPLWWEELLALEVATRGCAINLIASENYPSPAVCKVVGSLLMSKYAEGYPGKRYYSGCGIVDDWEVRGINLAKQLFGAEHANLQPHSGSQANLAAYNALLQPGERILAMAMDAGGHLTHGHAASIVAKLYDFRFYGLSTKTQHLDWDNFEQQVVSWKPKLVVMGASSYPLQLDFARAAQITKANGALLMVDMAHIAGLVAVGLHPSPVPWADVVTSTTHKTLRGPRGGLILCKAALAQAIDRSVMPGVQGGAHMNLVAAKAVALSEAMVPSFKLYQQNVLDNAQALGDELVANGWRLACGGTQTHMLLIDLKSRLPADGPVWTGRQAAARLEEIGIWSNGNLLWGDPLCPPISSGLRLGTPAVTTLGLGRAEMIILGQIISQALEFRLWPADRQEMLRQQVLELTQCYK